MRVISTTPMKTNHSHVCGINEKMTEGYYTDIESFPRMWDQQRRYDPELADNRIIPTYVGSTRSPLVLTFSRSNHSHVCGINYPWSFSAAVLSESFPRMWDQRSRSQDSDGTARIIPTYVGSTSVLIFGVVAPANHSHVCGINIRMTSQPPTSFESFPRMWDQQARTNSIAKRVRIIPTYVGSTLHTFSNHNTHTNHSHVCGINISFFIFTSAYFESFPRMWDQL